MISVIIPVFNAEPYIEKCIDSILAQTYRDLEVLIIDNGSTDRSGRICDGYEKTDGRVRVFHLEKRGLSQARNKGLDEAKGEWIGFVDSDDWIEPDMYECLLRRAEESGADIAECGFFREGPKKKTENKRELFEAAGMEAVRGILRSKLSNMVWNKLYRRHCFESIRFPENRVYEDVATTYRVFMASNRVCTVEDCKYHYMIRQGSLSRTHSTENLVGFWLSQKERFDCLCTRLDEAEKDEMIQLCCRAAARTWAYYCDHSDEDWKAFAAEIGEMNRFVRQHVPLFGFREWNTEMRIGAFFPHFDNKLSFRLAWCLAKVQKRLTGQR